MLFGLRDPPISREDSRGHGLPRHHQSRHPARQPADAGRYPVEPDRAALRRAAAAGVFAGRHSGRRGRAGRPQIQRRAHRLYRRLDRAGAHPVRRRPANQACHLPQRAGAGGDAGDRRRAGHHAHHRAHCQAGARSRLDPGTTGRRGGGVHRRGGSVPADQRPRLAPAPARARDPRSRIRHQRSLRRGPVAGASRDAAGRRSKLVARAGDLSARYRARLCHRLCRRARHHPGAQPGRACPRPARAVRGRERRGRLCLCQLAARLGFPRGLSCRPCRRQPADARAQFNRRVSRRRHLAGADRHVRAARPAGLAASPRRQPWSAPFWSRWC